MASHFRHRALFVGPNARAAVNEGRADYVPVFLSEVPHLFERGALPLDAVLVNATPPDAHGFCSLGVSVEAMHAAIRAARTVIVQFNRAMPRTLGESFIHVDEIDLAVEVDVPPYEHPSGPIGEVERRIGEHVAELVPDGATLQLGIGAIPSATALALRGQRDLGIHTEMFTDAVVDLVEAGVVTGARKERNRGKIVAAFVMGTTRLYDFVNDNPMVEMRSVDFTNDTHVIRSFRPMTAINSAIEVDLSGQVVADFDRLADLQRRGRPDGLRPGSGPGAGGPGDHRPALDGGRRHDLANQPVLTPGAGVVTTRAHVRTVVTEWGVAELFGRSLRERAAALIAIAHPDQRDWLSAEARRLGRGLSVPVVRSAGRPMNAGSACSWPARRRTGSRPSPGWRCPGAARRIRTRARHPGAQLGLHRRMWPGPCRSSAEVITTSAPTIRPLTTSVPLWTPELAARDTSGPSWGRRIAIQRTGSRISQGWLSSSRGTTSSASRSKSGW